MIKRRLVRPDYGALFSREKDSALIRGALERLLESAGDNPKKLERLGKALRAPKRLSLRMGKLLADAAASVAPALFRDLKTRGPSMLRERRAMISGFEERLYKTWQRPLDLLEMLIVTCSETGESLSAQWPWRKSPDQDLVFDVVRRLQARACQVASEILSLLKAGYAPAAHARWRTLHETAATAFFITKYGKEAAERFLLHEHVEAQKAAQQYQRYCRKLGYPRYSRKEMASFRRNYNAVLKKYGKEFRNDYGWAALTLGKKRAFFSDIERVVRLDHLRPYYKMASYPVHATVQSIRTTLALMPGQDMLLTGPSNLGLTDPGHSTAISLNQITITMTTLWPSSDGVSLNRVLFLFEGDIGDAFIKAQRRLEAKGRPRRKRR